MNVLDEWIEKTASMLPEECTTKDLVEAKIFTSPQAATAARNVGHCPPYLKLGRRVMYPKKGVVKWLQERKHDKDSTPNVDLEKIIRAATIAIQSGVANNCRP